MYPPVANQQMIESTDFDQILVQEPYRLHTCLDLLVVYLDFSFKEHPMSSYKDNANHCAGLIGKVKGRHE